MEIWVTVLRLWFTGKSPLCKSCPNFLKSCRQWELNWAQRTSTWDTLYDLITQFSIFFSSLSLLCTVLRGSQAPSSPPGSSTLGSPWAGAKTSQWMDWWTCLWGPRGMHFCSGKNSCNSTPTILPKGVSLLPDALGWSSAVPTDPSHCWG